jgi:hypothetical protein
VRPHDLAHQVQPETAAADVTIGVGAALKRSKIVEVFEADPDAVVLDRETRAVAFARQRQPGFRPPRSART